MNETEPPNFSGNYPLAGERIGPAWRMAWRELCDASRTRRPWLSTNALISVMCPAGPIEDITARNLLRAARKAGVVAVKYDGPRGEARYRIPKDKR